MNIDHIMIVVCVKNFLSKNKEQILLYSEIDFWKKISVLMASIYQVRKDNIKQWCPTIFSLSPHLPQLWRQMRYCRHFCQNFKRM